MEIFETLEDEFDEYFDSHTIPRRNPVYRERINYMELLDETDFRVRFRLTKKAVMFVYSIVEKAISVLYLQKGKNRAIRPITRLLLTLRFYATGSFLTVVGDFSGVSKASASRIVYLVSQAIARLRSEFIRFTTNTQEIQQEFYNIAKFPRLIGAIDCTHVPIKSPGGNSAEDWRNRKSQFSYNV
ncbi:hypothetical protein PYW08_009168 [Mythimna loreyi]|uniref:Uncharacterized protein n=1 Tax=Mythimna loreyi TaxID=667449 RepID=A0ACC2Q9N7_9NEOP|nr:hypothetical protein PYW08_009168 [Mythimna loreyi]